MNNLFTRIIVWTIGIWLICFNSSVWSKIKQENINFSFLNTVRYENYWAKKNIENSPYQYRGSQEFDEFLLNLNYKHTPYNTWRSEVLGVVNDSKYRSQYNGLVIERWNLFHEQGDVSLPYRVEAGDFMGFFSYRTLQTSLKGVQLELQPQQKNVNHSILFFIGANEPSWRDFTPKDDYTFGGSYLINRSGENLGFNVVYNVHKNREDKESPDLQHRVCSITGSKEFSIASQNISLEGEISYYKGDDTSNKTHSAMGYYCQLSGRAKIPLNYRLKFEDYGRYYSPPGASVASNRRFYELELGFIFPKGLLFTPRWQLSQDRIHSDNRQDTTIYGINLSGPLPLKLNFSMDSFLEKVKDEDNTVDQSTYSTTINITKFLTKTLNGRLSLAFSDTQLPHTTSNIQKSVSAGIDWTPLLSEGSFTLSPNIGLQQQSGKNSESNLFYTGFNLNFSIQNHSLSSSVNMEFQDLSPSEDVKTYTWNLTYQYQIKSSTIGLEFDSNFRDPTKSESTESYKIALFWRYNFTKKREKTPAPPALLASSPPGVLIPERPLKKFDIIALPPRITILQAEDILRTMGLVDGVRQGNLIIYEGQMLEEINQRQRLVLITKDNILEKTVLIIDYQSSGRVDDIKRTFEYIKQILFKEYGTPVSFYEKGDFAHNLSQLIANREFIRNYEWHLPAGIVRLGIPKRSDRKVRIEIHFGRNFPSIKEPQWGLDEVF